MGIREEDVAQVRAAVDFVEVASEHMALKKVGRRWTGLCPFHGEKTPSFSLNAEEGLYYCFGCQAKGDVITFVREIEHLDFVEAIERLATRAGIELRYDDEATKKDRQRRDRLIEALERATEWYHERLLTADDAASARGYLRSRGYDGETVRQFRLGWAPDEFDALSKALRLPDDVLRDTGLGFLNRRNRQQDAFRGRVMFPIFDPSGHTVAFGGRQHGDSDGPKYKNSQETPVYSKRRTLYGLNWAKATVAQAGEIVLCEGYTDVIGMHRAGIPNAVATCGTALTEEHVRLLKNFAPRIVLAYDADSAGQSAAERFYEWEGKYDIDIAVAGLPEGRDPGDVAERDPAALQLAVKEAQPFLGFRLQRVLDGSDMRSPEGRARAAASAVAVVREHPNELVRDQYLMQVADRCRIDVERLRTISTTRAASRTKAPVQTERPRDITRPPEPEVEALRLALHHPDVVASLVDDVHQLEWLFADEVAVQAYRALLGADTLHEAIDRAEPDAADLLQELAVEEASEPAPDAILRLVDRAATRVVAEIEAIARSESSGDLADLSSTIGWLRVAAEDLRGDTGGDGARRLVAWLATRSEEEG